MITDVAKRAMESLSKKQKSDLILLVDECVELGATIKQLAPLYAVCLINPNPKLTKQEKEYANKLAKGLAKK